MHEVRGELSVLIERVLGAESSAWHELWHRVEPMVWGISGKWQVAGPLCKSADDRREIVLRVMERLREADFRRLRCFARSAGGGSDNAFRSWLATLAARVAIDHVRAHPEHIDSRGRRGGERWAKLVSIDDVPVLSEERDLTQRTTALRVLERAREELSVQQLTALSIWLDGAGAEAIADRLGLSDKDAGLRVLRAALKRLRDRYREGDAAVAHDLRGIPMTNCPDVESLLNEPALQASHVAECAACGGITALAELREERIAGNDDACVHAEVSIALLHEGLLSEQQHANLVDHLEGCPSCNETAARLLALPVFAPEGEAATEVFAPPSARSLPRWVFALGGAAAVAVALGLFWFALRAPAPEPPPTVAFEPVGTDEASGGVGSSSPAGGAARTPGIVTPVPIRPFAPRASTPADPVPDIQGPGFLTILCVPTCTSIIADGGRQLGSSPIVRARLKPGMHSIRLTNGTVTRVIQVSIAADQTTARRVTMSPDDVLLNPFASPKAPAKADPTTNEPKSDAVLDPWAKPGFLSVICQPACDSVTIAGKNLGPSPVVRAPLQPGTRVVSLARGGLHRTSRVKIVSGQTTAIRIHMVDPMDLPR